MGKIWQWGPACFAALEPSRTSQRAIAVQYNYGVFSAVVSCPGLFVIGVGINFRRVVTAG